MDGERKSCTERILSAIEYGKLSNDETERRLCKLVEAEVNKTDSEADRELVKACQSLMWQLHTHGELPYDSHYDENKAKIDQRLKRNTLISNTVKSVGKMLAAAAAVVLVVLGFRGDLHWSWLEHNDTFDQQQHIIAGNEIGVELIQSAIAEHLDKGVLQLSDISVIHTEFEFAPIPEQLHETWHFDSAMVFTGPDMIRLDISYRNADSEHTMLYTIIMFTSAEDAYFAFEQSEAGYVTDILGNQVYVSQNIDELVMCWTQGLAAVRITGVLEESEGMAIIESLIGVWTQ